MRYAPEHKEKTRARILAAAGKVFRRLGYHAAGVDKVMEEAGLTAGGFYAHFDSKQALLAEAIEHAGAESRRAASGLDGRTVRTRVGRSVPGRLPRARTIAVRSKKAVRWRPWFLRFRGLMRRVKASFEAIVRELESKLASHVGGCGPADAKERALAAVALCVGGLGLARSVQDEAFAERIIRSCRKHGHGSCFVPERRCPSKPGGEARPGNRSANMRRGISNRIESGDGFVDRAERRVVVTGLGMVTPVGLDVESTWESLTRAEAGLGRSACSMPARSRRESPPS